MAVSPNAARAYVYFKSRGFSDVAAAGLVGTLMQESGPNLNVKAYNPNDPGGSYGIMQANRDRKANLIAYKDPSARDELERQLSFIANRELKGSEAGTMKRLSAAQNLDQAAQAAIGYERPSGWKSGNPTAGHGYGNRLKYAQQVYADQTGQNPVVASAPSASGGGPVGEGAASPVVAAATAAPEPPDPVAEGLSTIMNAFAPGSIAPVSPMQEAPAAPAEAAPAPPAPAPAPAGQPPSQGSAASLMASLLDRKRQERGGLLDPAGIFG